MEFYIDVRPSHMLLLLEEAFPMDEEKWPTHPRTATGHNTTTGARGRRKREGAMTLCGFR